MRKTQEEIGKKVGVGKATIQKYENGIITKIPSDKIELLAEALETTPGFIMGWENDPERFRLDNQFGKLLQKERLSMRMSTAQFAEYIGISEDALARYESGSSIPSINVAMSIAIQLGISPEQYDPIYIAQKQKSEDEKLNEEIIRLFSSLSHSSKLRALAYIQGLKDSEETKEVPSSAQ